MSPGQRPTSVPNGILIHPAGWDQDAIKAYARKFRKWGLQCPFTWGGAGSPSNTVWPGLRPTRMPSFISIRPTVWPQYTNVTDRQTGQTGQRSDSIRRTVFGRPFVKRLALCYRTVGCLACPVLCVTLVYCDQTVGWNNSACG